MGLCGFVGLGMLDVLVWWIGLVIYFSLMVLVWVLGLLIWVWGYG